MRPLIRVVISNRILRTLLEASLIFSMVSDNLEQTTILLQRRFASKIKMELLQYSNLLLVLQDSILRVAGNSVTLLQVIIKSNQAQTNNKTNHSLSPLSNNSSNSLHTSSKCLCKTWLGLYLANLELIKWDQSTKFLLEIFSIYSMDLPTVETHSKLFWTISRMA